ncbi:MAG: ABC transporter permease, partial [Gemmatimonadales bacterium]
QAASYAGTAAFGIRRLGLRERAAASGPGTEPLWGMLVSGEYFQVLGVNPRLGRLIGPEDTRAIGNGFVGVISHALWQRRFGGSSGVIGRRIELNGREITVVGVAPPGFAGTYVGLSFDVWVPLPIQEALGGSPAALQDREYRWLQAFGRLRPGVAPEQARAEALRIGRRLAAQYPASEDVSLVTQTLDVGAASRLAPLFAVLLGLAIIVLVVVCATVSNLLMAQAATREVEMATRLAIGGRPGRLVRQLLTESTLLALAGGGLGALLSVKARALFPALLPPSPLPLSVNTPLDARVIVFAVAITALILLVFGLVPALGAVRKAMASGLRGGLGPDRARVRWRRGLVAAQIAFSLAALASTGIFARRLLELGDVDRGFAAPDKVLLVTTDLDLAGIEDPEERRTVINGLLEAVRGYPGVVDATIASFVPLGFTGYREADLDVPGYEQRPGEPATALLNEIGPAYFELLGIPLVAGRAINHADRAGGQPVAVVNQAFVKRFGLGDPVGRRIRVGDREVVVAGVAGDGKYRFDELDQPARPLVYVPWTQWGAAELTLHVRTRGEATALVPSLSGAFAAADPRLPVLTPMTLDAYTSLPLFPGRLATTVVGTLAAVALALSALGLYGLTRLTIDARRRELGLRMALGAAPRHLLKLLFDDAARFASIGLVLGLGLAVLATRMLLKAIPHLHPDPPAVLAAGLLLVLILGAATLLAAWRALGIDPAIALRDE